MSVSVNDIQISKVKDEPGETSLRVEVPVDRVEAAERKATTYWAKRVRMPGFRKGKAPLDVVRKKYRDAIRESVIQDLVTDSWRAAVDQEDLKPIADPRIRELKFEDGAPVTFELQVEVKPEITLDRLGGFHLTRKVTPVDADMVEEQLDEVRRQKAPWVPVEHQQPKAGELASITIATLAEGESDEPRQYQVVLGSGQAIPDLEEEIMKLTPGQTADASVRYPDDFPEEAKRGQSRTVRITLHEVKRQELPELTDEFAREVGDFESADALRSAIREDLEAHAAREADAEVRRQLIEQIIAANGLEAPRPLVQRVLSAYAQSYEIPDEQLEKFATEFGPVAERHVQRDLILDHVAGKEDLSATEEDVDRRIEEIAKRRNAEPAQVYASLQKANQLREIERSLTEEKVFELLLEQSTVTDE
jgi:trigger factor